MELGETAAGRRRPPGGKCRGGLGSGQRGRTRPDLGGDHRIWEATTGQFVRELKHPEGAVVAVAFSREGNWLWIRPGYMIATRSSLVVLNPVTRR